MSGEIGSTRALSQAAAPPPYHPNPGLAPMRHDAHDLRRNEYCSKLAFRFIQRGFYHCFQSCKPSLTRSQRLLFLVPVLLRRSALSTPALDSIGGRKDVVVLKIYMLVLFVRFPWHRGPLLYLYGFSYCLFISPHHQRLV